MLTTSLDLDPDMREDADNDELAPADEISAILMGDDEIAVAVGNLALNEVV